MKGTRLRALHLFLMIATGAAVLYGIVVLWSGDASVGRHWVREDGPVEWVSFGALLASMIWSLIVAGRVETRAARTVWCLIAAALAFGAIEEISYGQRIFGWESPDWFLRYNSQQETNLHNLRFGDVKLNKLIFGKGIAVFLIAYLVVLPVAWRLSARTRDAVDGWGVPIPRTHHVVCWLIAITSLQLVNYSHSREGELVELAGTVAFFLILTRPHNAGRGELAILSPEGGLADLAREPAAARPEAARRDTRPAPTGALT